MELHYGARIKELEEEVARLRSRIGELEQSDEAWSWCTAEAMDALAQVGCKHGHDHKGTPPMMIREYVYCVAGTLKASATKAEGLWEQAVNLYPDLRSLEADRD